MSVLSHLRHRDNTPDAHAFPTRPYDLVKEFVIALVVVGLMTVALAVVFSSPDRPAITLAAWAKAAPNDVVATATAELAGTSGTAGYGPPYNHASPGQTIGPLHLQKWAGVRTQVDAAKDLVISPLKTVRGDKQLAAALKKWGSASDRQHISWAGAYADALASAPKGDPSKTKRGDYGPVPVLARKFLTLARTGSLEGRLTTSRTFYGTDTTLPLLLLSDGTYLEDQARADHLGGDQWGMMNETGNYPGQPWLWLYTFWYQVKPFSTSENADAWVWGLMMLLTLGLVFIPYIPVLRSVPRYLGVHRLIWRRST